VVSAALVQLLDTSASPTVARDALLRGADDDGGDPSEGGDFGW